MEDRMKDDCDCAVCAAAAPPMATAASAGSAAASAAKAGPPRSASAALGVAGAFTLRRELPFLIGAAAAFGLGLAMKAGFPRSLAGFEAGPAVLFIASYLLAGRDVLMGAMRNIVRGRVLDELFLMSIATIGAIAIGRFEEAVEVMALYKVGEAIQASASRKSRASVRDLLELKPTTVRLRRDRSWVLVDPDLAAAGDEFMVMPGERIALDGEVVEGECFVDTSALTGESMPRRIEPGVEVLAGCVALDGSFKAVASRPAKESAAARIALLVEEASRSKAKSARMITRFSRVYTPIVVAAAALLAFAPPLLVPGPVLLGMDISSPRAPGHLLSLRPRHQRAPRLFLRHGSDGEERHTGQGSRGAGRPRPRSFGRLRQDGHSHRGQLHAEAGLRPAGLRRGRAPHLGCRCGIALAAPHRGVDTRRGDGAGDYPWARRTRPRPSARGREQASWP